MDKKICILLLAACTAMITSAFPSRQQKIPRFHFTNNQDKEKAMITSAFPSQQQKISPFHFTNQDKEKELLIHEGISDDLAEDQTDPLSLLTRYAGMGYNMLYANPEGDFLRGGLDPGIKTTRFIFKLTENSNKQSFYNGQAVTVPDQVAFHGVETCAEKSSTHAYSGQTSYRKELSYNLDASASYYSGIFGARFSLSHGMQSARKETENKREVIVQHNRICNYGAVRYLLEDAISGAEGYELSENFKNAVRLLPSHYSQREYTRFIDNWGTDIIEEAQVGTHTISRSQATYKDAFKFLSTQTSNGVSAGGEYAGYSGEIRFDIGALEESVTQNSVLGEKWNSFTVGTKEVPLPIFLRTASINITLNDHFWDSSERQSIRQKKIHLQKALTDYPANKRAQISGDPTIRVKIQWPDSRFSLPEPSYGCPQGWSTGWRYQDTEDDDDQNSKSPSDIRSYMRVEVGRNIKSFFCTKTEGTNNGFVWPRGTYCIAMYNDYCPSGFSHGFRKWDDEDSGNENDKSGTLPSGQYDGNTMIHFCCRRDGRHDSSVFLPTGQPFILYRYQGRCQSVAGMSFKSLLVYWDNEDDNSISDCSGEYPDGQCDRNQGIDYCYYS